MSWPEHTLRLTQVAIREGNPDCPHDDWETDEEEVGVVRRTCTQCGRVEQREVRQ